LKIDRYIKDLSYKLNSFSNNGNGNNDDKDDDYYLDIGSEPPRFLYYRHVRAQEWEALGHKGSDYDGSIAQDELDYALKEELRISPEQRYRQEKAEFLFHN
jgi:hypothetical protein